MYRFAGVLLTAALWGADYQAGVSRLIITPDKPIYLSGYANGTHASEGKIHDLWAKVLAIRDAKGNRAVLVSTDLIGLPRGIADVVAARVQKEYGIDRAHLVLNSSHTHTGPMERGNLTNLFDLKPEDQ